LGFAEKTGLCATDAINSIKTFGIANCNTRIEIGMKYVSIYIYIYIYLDFVKLSNSKKTKKID